MTIKDQKLLYHLTCIDNLESILRDGLQPRSALTSYVDVADGGIIQSRRKLQLENYVPFHFFAGNPFDGRVQLDHPDKSFVLITVRRAHARAQNWWIIPCHPLAGQEPTLLEYDAGFEAIEWGRMDSRDYRDDVSKSVCMAECLSPSAVPPRRFSSLFLANQDHKDIVDEMLRNNEYKPYLNVNANMFVRKRESVSES